MYMSYSKSWLATNNRVTIQLLLVHVENTIHLCCTRVKYTHIIQCMCKYNTFCTM